MKKIFLVILIFAILSFSITGVLINMKTGKIDEFISGDTVNDIENSDDDMSKEKTLDLYGTYNQNDLKIESVEEQIKYVATPIKIPTIVGLRDKDVENKINNDIRERIIGKFNEDLNKYTQVGHIDSSMYTHANFANVISINFYLNYQENGKYKSEEIFLNYELINGERLKFEDLFVKDVNTYEMLRKAFYEVLASNSVNASFWSRPYYDRESGEWKINIVVGYDEQSGAPIFNEIQYIPELTEHEVNKMIKTFMNKEEKNFYFTPTTIYIEAKEISFSYVPVDFVDVAKDIIIYDEYLTDESLYEESNIGVKNLWNCTNLDTSGHYETGFALDNLYYEIVLNHYYEPDNDYPYKESLKILKDRDMERANKKLEEYKQIARNNPDKFYIARINPYVFYDYNYKYQFSGYSNDEKYYNLISNGINILIGYVDVGTKENVVKDIIQLARDSDYAGYLDYFLSSYEFGDVYGGIIVEDKPGYQDAKLYDARTLLERKSVESIFKKNVDYMSVLKAEVQEDFERYSAYKTQQEIDEILKNTTYVLTNNSIELDGYDWTGIVPSIQFSDIDNNLVTLYETGGYILSKSSVIKFEKSELQNLSLDELNKAYNEIFARHGHEFKGAELKEYFSNQSWYNPIPNKTVTLEELNEIEKYNLDIIKSVISEKKNT